MKVSIIKSANEVVLGSWQITNQKLARFMMTINDIKNNLKKRRYTYWVKVSFEGEGIIEVGSEPMCIGDYDEYTLSSEMKVIIPVGDVEEAHKQYICSHLNVLTTIQSKTLSENEEIIIAYTEIIEEENKEDIITKQLLKHMKDCLFKYQMQAYMDYSNEPMDREVFDKRVSQILNILPQLDQFLIEEDTDELEQEIVHSEEAVEETNAETHLLIPEVEVIKMEELEDKNEEQKLSGLVLRTMEPDEDTLQIRENLMEGDSSQVKWIKLNVRDNKDIKREKVR